MPALGTGKNFAAITSPPFKAAIWDFFQLIFGWRYRLPHFNFVLNRLFWLNYEFGGGFPLSFTIWLLKAGFPRALLEVSCICDSLALLKRVASPHISVLLLLCVFVSVYCFKMSVCHHDKRQFSWAVLEPTQAQRLRMRRWESVYEK